VGKFVLGIRQVSLSYGVVFTPVLQTR